ncbi:hypothetical protein COCON_G00002490 [Conger conger]|uniref:CARD domain-containing protein n=1 Tax=Conger conger TaxID=82655 RepID=A0A9Q1E0S9_CONCO|nr:hypothetical protein COCON_G00002490 [Conger conger]
MLGKTAGEVLASLSISPVGTEAPLQYLQPASTPTTASKDKADGRGGGPTPAAGACGTTAEKHFIDRHRTALIERVCNVTPILDRLLERGVVTQSGYDEIQAGNTTQDKTRKLLSGPIHSGGGKAKDVLFKILETQEPFLMDDLKGH